MTMRMDVPPQKEVLSKVFESAETFLPQLLTKMPGANPVFEKNSDEFLGGALFHGAKKLGFSLEDADKARGSAGEFRKYLESKSAANERVTEQELFDAVDKEMEASRVDDGDEKKIALILGAMMVRINKAKRSGLEISDADLGRWKEEGVRRAGKYRMHRQILARAREAARAKAEAARAEAADIQSMPKEYPELYAEYPKLLQQAADLHKELQGYKSGFGESSSLLVTKFVGEDMDELTPPGSRALSLSDLRKLRVATNEIKDEIARLTELKNSKTGQYNTLGKEGKEAMKELLKDTRFTK